MHLRQFVLPSLGHVSALMADDERGVAAVIDPRRAVDIYLEEARARELRITPVFETHLHNDYVSGGRELAEMTGAVHVIGAGAELATPFLGVRDGDSVDCGSPRFVAPETPRPTPGPGGYAGAERAPAAPPAPAS